MAKETCKCAICGKNFISVGGIKICGRRYCYEEYYNEVKGRDYE